MRGQQHENEKQKKNCQEKIEINETLQMVESIRYNWRGNSLRVREAVAGGRRFQDEAARYENARPIATDGKLAVPTRSPLSPG